MEPAPHDAAFFRLEAEPTQIGRSRSRLRQLTLVTPQMCLAVSNFSNVPSMFGDVQQ